MYIRFGLYFFIFGLSIYKLEVLKELYDVVFVFFGLGILSILIGDIQFFSIKKKF